MPTYRVDIASHRASFRTFVKADGEADALTVAQLAAIACGKQQALGGKSEVQVAQYDEVNFAQAAMGKSPIVRLEDFEVKRVEKTEETSK